METQEEALYTTQTKLTFDEYVKFSNRVCRFRNICSYILWIGIGGALAVWAFIRGNYMRTFLVLCGCVSLVYRGQKVKKEKLEKAFEDPEGTGSALFTFYFYSDNFVQICNTDRSEPFYYYDLDTIIETDTNFYLVYNRYEGGVIIKENCSPDLVRFLHNLKAEPKSPLYNKNRKAQISYNKTAMAIIEKLGLPCEAMDINLSEQEMMDRYYHALEVSEQEGIPILIPAHPNFLDAFEAGEEEGISREELMESELPDARHLLDIWYEEALEVGEDPDDLSEFMGTMAGGRSHNRLVNLEQAREYDLKVSEVLLCKVPTDKPWKALAYFPSGGWNGCPMLQEIMAVGKYWYEKYGAVPAAIGYDSIEFIVQKDISMERDAWDVAKDQFAFSQDVVYQCTESGTLGELADEIRQSKMWYIWWD